MAVKKRRQKRKRPGSPKKRALGGFVFRGLITLLPAFLTLIIFGLLFQMVDRYITGPINDVIYWSLERSRFGWEALGGLGIDPLDKDYIRVDLLSVDLREHAAKRGLGDPNVLELIQHERARHLGFFRDLEDLAINSEKLRTDVAGVVHPGYGILLSALVVLALAWIVGGFIGRTFMLKLDRMFHVIPVVKSIYPYSKQLVEFFFAERKLEFDTVVAVQYPSPGIWSIAFVTGNALRTLQEEVDGGLLTCFVPSSPMPMTGYTVFTHSSRVVPLPISVDEALRVTMSGGVLVPPREKVDEDEEMAGMQDVEWIDYSDSVEVSDGMQRADLETQDEEDAGEEVR